MVSFKTGDDNVSSDALDGVDIEAEGDIPPSYECCISTGTSICSGMMAAPSRIIDGSTKMSTILASGRALIMKDLLN